MMMSEGAPPVAAAGPGPAPSHNPVIKVGIGAGALAGWHVASDMLAPAGNAGAVVGYTTQIAPRVSGQVTEVLVADNARVSAGDRLFALDPAPFDLAVRQAEVALHQALRMVGASQESLVGAQAQVNQAQAALESARAAAERMRSLPERGIIAKAQRDAAENDLAAAQSGVDAAQANLEAARRQLGEEGQTNPQIEAAEVQLEQALMNRCFATVVAPMTGW